MNAWWQRAILERHDAVSGASVLLDICVGNWSVYEYDRVVFFVRPIGDIGWVHVFSEGGNLLRATRLFMEDAVGDFKMLAARVTVPHIGALAERFGWCSSEALDDGFRVYVFTVKDDPIWAE